MDLQRAAENFGKHRRPSAVDLASADLRDQAGRVGAELAAIAALMAEAPIDEGLTLIIGRLADALASAAAAELAARQEAQNAEAGIADEIECRR